MFTILSFLLMIAGGINWLLIGLLQYDFVAGIFGFQGSVFSRLIYILIGAACLFFVFKVFKGKGTVAIFSRRNKKDVEKNLAKMQGKPSAEVEAGHDYAESQHDQEFQERNERNNEEGLLNEHLHKDD